MLSNILQDIEKGNHIDERCEEYRNYYEVKFGQKLPNCQFKGNQSQIRKLIKKVHVNANGSETEIQFDIKENDEDFT